MAFNTDPSFIRDPILASAQVSAANANRDGTGTIVTVVTSSVAEGVKITAIVIKAIVTTTAGMIRLFINDGVNTRLWREVPVDAITASASVAAFEFTLVPPEPLVLPNTYSLRASTENAEAHNIMAFGGDLQA